MPRPHIFLPDPVTQGTTDPQTVEAALQALSRQLQRSLEHLARAQTVAGLGSWHGREVLEFSDLACRILGQPPGCRMGLDCVMNLVARLDRARVRRHWRQALRHGPIDLEFRLAAEDKDRLTQWVHVQAEVQRDAQGHLTEVIGTLQNITLRKAEEAHARLAARIFDSANESIIVTDAQRNIVAVNAAFTRITGYTAEEVLGKNPRLVRSGRQDRHFYAGMWRQLKEQGSFQGEFWNRAKDGRLYALIQTISVLRNEEGRLTHYVGIGIDVSSLREAEDRSRYLSTHDLLTDLPNRLTIAERTRALLVSRRDARLGSVLVVLGVDNFKAINDSMGHHAGDSLLVELADRLRALAAQGMMVGRLGGDEFLVMTTLAGRDQAGDLARSLLDQMSVPFRIEGHELAVTVSAGISVYPSDGADFDALLKNAETALYGAKSDGRNAIRFYDPQMNVESLERLILVSALRRAIPAGELRSWYQPKIDLATGRPVGAEALVRWQHPEQGFIPPGRFIPAAESLDLIVAIGEWMLEEACAQIARWQACGLGWIPVAVNLGARHFTDVRLADHLRRLLARHAIPAGILELEITESTLLMGDADPTALLTGLRAAGVRLAIDDFGTGYSSLSYLKRLPVDMLKIDRSFVHNIATDSADRSIAATIIALARGLGLEVVAEGIEESAQRDLLRQDGCAVGQGFLFARPMPAEQFEAWWRAAPDESKTASP